MYEGQKALAHGALRCRELCFCCIHPLDTALSGMMYILYSPGRLLGHNDVLIELGCESQYGVLFSIAYQLRNNCLCSRLQSVESEMD